ncbi:GNAT family N-acetyltransferase [Planosporangium thailandense]|uniref:GNAT family N-acetyltransferase n=1 Tax=Planosporangium thailandense TaxID=765197 RepID=A0ABX0Y561_9ACTN|nr:GNAT family N-acetyltransferase [Planosporangium thailandense]NJC72474.1 GNAT family N-acetyltransferase [Planosporangium thailandense]
MLSITIRPGGPGDVPSVLALLDRATEWLVANGRIDQWGTEPHSTNPRRVAQVTASAHAGELWIAEADRQPVGALPLGALPAGALPLGALSVGAALPYVPAVDEPELYVQLLVTDRSAAGQGVGAALLDHARTIAREQGVALLRVDCFAGGDGSLVRYYERQGFTRAEPFTVTVGDTPWPGQVLAQRLRPRP